MSATPAVFARYPNPVFVETGTYLGDGVAAALEAGFTDVRSIELEPALFRQARERFRDDGRVRLYEGDSAGALARAIRDVTTTITFWLDAHYSEGVTARGSKNTPIAEELAVIASHPVRGHTILIDDVRCFGTEIFEGYRLEDAVEAIHAIAPGYRIAYEDGTIPGDIVAATPAAPEAGR